MTKTIIFVALFVVVCSVTVFGQRAERKNSVRESVESNIVLENLSGATVCYQGQPDAITETFVGIISDRFFYPTEISLLSPLN